VPVGDEALRFAERLLALLDAAHYTATYKFAALLALIDVAAERTGPDRRKRVRNGTGPRPSPYGAPAHGEPKALSQAPQNDIPFKLAAFRAGQAERTGPVDHHISVRQPDVPHIP
jgi:hypothetical protein